MCEVSDLAQKATSNMSECKSEPTSPAEDSDGSEDVDLLSTVIGLKTKYTNMYKAGKLNTGRFLLFNF